MASRHMTDKPIMRRWEQWIGFVWASGIAVLLLVATFLLSSLAYYSSAEGDEKIPLLPEFNLYSPVTATPLSESGEVAGPAIDIWTPIRTHTTRVNKMLLEINRHRGSAASAAAAGYITGAITTFISLVMTLLGPWMHAIRAFEGTQ